jgi:hydroxymethyl cephem carbamoyltransferase
MQILSFKPGHDGSVALVEDGRLIFSLESEKDSFPRYSEITPPVLFDAMALADGIPDVVCLSGWVKGFHSAERSLGAGYFGWSESTCLAGESTLFGKPVQTFTSSHERSHLMSAYGMSPFPQGEPYYALVWEGNIGSFYEFTPDAGVRLVAPVLEDPGNKYQFIFGLADPAATQEYGGFRFSNAGKLMALAGHAVDGPLTGDERELIEFVLTRRSILLSTPKNEVAWSPFHNIGVESQELKNLAAKHSQAIFKRFHAVAERELRHGYPLLISGGCGLNCDWNTQWRESGLFEAVFVPPVTNDTGSAIGTAIDAQRHFTGEAKLDWNVYAGSEFDDDADPPGEFERHHLDLSRVAQLLAEGRVLAWVQGRCEIGPRALGNRSLLAAPFDAAMCGRLNKIKEREAYRPIAPVCLEEDVAEHFGWLGESPYMLHFQRVRTSRLEAVTHADGTARVQTVRADQNRPLHALLREFREKTGSGVLCNTSLNFPGRGFINRTSDLVQYARQRGLDGFVLRDQLFLRHTTMEDRWPVAC